MAADYYQLYRRLLPPRLWYNQGTNLSYPDAALPFGV
jgi:hypothetical protein